MAVDMEHRTLNEIGLLHSTDKSSIFHNYLSFYDLLFTPIRNKPIRLLEIGVQFGFSLKTWADYFPNALIHGIDSASNDLKFDLDDRIIFWVTEAYSEKTVDTYSIMPRFDIIIDDASHAPQDQVWCVHNYSKLLSDTGFLIIEDVPSKDVVPALKAVVPEGFNSVAIDMTEGGPPDSRLFIVWRHC